MNKRIFVVCLCLFIVCAGLFSGCGQDDTGGDWQTPLPVFEDFASQMPAVPQETSSAYLLSAGADIESVVENRLIGDDTPISRAMAAKMVAFINNDKKSLELYERDIIFSDTVPESWYDRYINACYTEKIMSGGAEDRFMPESPLTISQAVWLLKKISGEAAVTPEVTDENKDKAISYALWVELFMLSLEADGKTLADYGMEISEFVVLATPDNNSKLKEGNSITDLGPVTHSGISLADYIDKSVSTIKKDGEIIALLSLVSSAPTIKNAYVVSVGNGGITIFSGGAERTYVCNTSGLKTGVICDITVNGGYAVGVSFYSDTVLGFVKRVNSSFAELDGDASIPLDPDIKIYSTADGTVKWKSLSNIIVGSDIAVFVLKDGAACSAIITKGAVPENIRVLISTTGYGGYTHNSVRITSCKDFMVTSSGSTVKYPADAVYELESPQTVLSDDFGRVVITPSEGETLQILSVKRSWPGNESPKYRGILEIGMENGGYSIVNELDMESYLCAVIPSEMPTGYGLEAAKVQAVTARSFAYNQFFANRYHEYGANVDDSVLCQVYNNIPENENSMQAVKDTEGLCLVYGDDVISANFFSTSAGVTANSGEVWAGGREFPGETAPYLRSRSQLTEGELPDLSVENDAYKFFKDTGVKSYDSGFSWFRWNTEMTAAELADTINSSLAVRYNANPRLIKTLQRDGGFKSVPISSIGDIADMEVVRRGEGGNIMGLKITGTEAAVLVLTEYNIRLLLKPAGPIYCVDGSTVNNYSMMPSAFFVFDKITNDSGSLSKITFYGGGMGHGVGMSQNGVKGMIDAGKTFDEILRHYYPGTEVVRMIKG